MPADLFNGDPEQMGIFLISRLPRLLAILCTGIGMSVAGLIMQQLCSNKFISPLDIFQIIMGIEEEFDIEIANEDAEHIVTVADAVEQIKNALN